MDVKKAPTTQVGQRTLHKEAVKTSSDQELALYERFFRFVSDKATSHRQITVNHLLEVTERLEQLKQDADTLKNRILFHQEEVVVNRQKVIRGTERRVETENATLLSFDHLRLEESLHAVDSLSQTLYAQKVGFRELHQRLLLSNLLSSESLFDFYLEKSAAVERILSKHNQAVFDRFRELDATIRDMDLRLRTLLQNKNEKIASIRAFYDAELRHYLDNQLTFSAVEDPTSIDAQALESDKIRQFNAFKAHRENEHLRLKSMWEAEYASLFTRLVQGYVRSKALSLTDDAAFFEQADEELKRLRDEAKLLDRKQDAAKLAVLDKKIMLLKQYPSVLQSAKRRAARMLSKQHRRRVELIRLSELTVQEEAAKLKKTLDSYLALMEIDPFLAQTVGDDSSKIIKEFRNKLSIVKVDSELETNITYDIQMAKLKHEINQLELELTQEVKLALIVQEKELLLAIHQIYRELLSRSRELFGAKHQIILERYHIERAELLANLHLRDLTDANNLHRRILTEATGKLIQSIRRKESHEIYVAEAKNDLDLLLKEYDMKALYFQTIYENELSFFVTQKMRIEAENDIHAAFVLTTYENQMRFAEEQVKLANSEYRARLESFLEVVDEQRNYEHALVEHHYEQYLEKRHRLDQDYQATLYASNHLLSETKDAKQKLALQKTVDSSKTDYDNKVAKLETSYHQHPIVVSANRKLAELDLQVERAILDAEQIRDVTIAEYSEQYHKAKERYDTLKPYFDKHLNILDPVFLERFEAMQSRLTMAKKAAEAELERLAAPKLQHYLEVYFQDADQPDYLSYKETILRLETEKAALEKASLDKQDAILRDIQAKIDAETLAYQAKLNEFLPMEALIDQKAKSIELEYRRLEDALKKEGTLAKAKRSDQASLMIDTLTAEYKKALQTHAGVDKQMAEEFEELTAMYKPYASVANRLFHTKRRLRAVKRVHAKESAKERRLIQKRYRHYRIPTGE